MSQKTRKEAINEAVNLLLAEEESMTEDIGPYRYARTVLQAFEEIRMLLGRGISFVRICRSFETTGILPENANVHSFREAFHRECKRRGEKYARTKPNEKKLAAEKKSAPNKALHTIAPPKPEPEKTSIESKEDRIRRMSGVKVDTGSSIITKYPDGSFDY